MKKVIKQAIRGGYLICWAESGYFHLRRVSYIAKCYKGQGFVPSFTVATPESSYQLAPLF